MWATTRNLFFFFFPILLFSCPGMHASYEMIVVIQAYCLWTHTHTSTFFSTCLIPSFLVHTEKNFLHLFLLRKRKAETILKSCGEERDTQRKKRRNLRQQWWRMHEMRTSRCIISASIHMCSIFFLYMYDDLWIATLEKIRGHACIIASKGSHGFHHADHNTPRTQKRRTHTFVWSNAPCMDASLPFSAPFTKPPFYCALPWKKYCSLCVVCIIL